MVDDPKIINKDGKEYCSLPDGTQALIENEIINDPHWINVQQAEAILKIGDRQIRNLAKKYSWDKKYAYINKKPVSYYLKSQLEDLQRNRVTEIITPTAEAEITVLKDELSSIETAVGTSLISKHTIEELDTVVKQLQPYIGDFLETYKKNQERIIALEEKKSSAEKAAVLWKTSAIWVTVLGALIAVSWFKLTDANGALTQANSNLNGKFESAQNELYETKLSLTKTQQELDLIKAQQKNSPQISNSAMTGKE